MASTDFYEGYLLVTILMIGVIMTGQNVIFGGIIIAEKKNKIMGFATMIGAIISVLFNLSLMKYGGIYIAAISSAVSFAAMNRMSYSEKSLKAPLSALFLFVVISFGLFYIVHISFSWGALFIKILLLTLYLVLLSKVFDIPIRDLTTVLKKR